MIEPDRSSKPNLVEIKKMRREVVKDPPVNADSILLCMYRRRIKEVYCIDCIDMECKDRGTANCYTPVTISILKEV